MSGTALGVQQGTDKHASALVAFPVSGGGQTVVSTAETTATNSVALSDGNIRGPCSRLSL